MIYDVIIIGTGSAGLPAGMYASRYKMSNLIIGKMPGGALATSHNVENYPGFLSSPGRDIMKKMLEQAKESGSEIIYKEVKNINKTIDNFFEIELMDGEKKYSKFAIIATGNSYKKLGIDTENKFLGKGVSYCATCDGFFFKNKDVGIVGGGNTAITEALYLSEICKSVTIIHRKDTFKAENSWLEKLKTKNNIYFQLNEEVVRLDGSEHLEKVKLSSGKKLNLDGLFIAIGSNPNTEILKNSNLNINYDEDGCIIVNKKQETSEENLFAAGDITTNSNKFKQAIMSAAEGCLAANSIHEKILEN